VIQLGLRSDPDPGVGITFANFAADAYYQRGICYDETGDHAKAMADYKEAVGIKPNLAKNEDLKRRMGK
jgi:tetratricopeptide (TPR) repeat protein